MIPMKPGWRWRCDRCEVAWTTLNRNPSRCWNCHQPGTQSYTWGPNTRLHHHPGGYHNQ